MISPHAKPPNTDAAVNGLLHPLQQSIESPSARDVASNPTRSAVSKKRRQHALGPAGVKPPTKRLRRKQGALARLVNMPIDILFEIFSHLHPLDVLHLARTTKTFRGFLMHRSSTAIWKSAFLTVTPPPPPCPLGYNEPQYASVAFCEDCHFCSCSKPRRTLERWQSYVRLCQECRSEQYINQSDVLQSLLDHPIPAHLGSWQTFLDLIFPHRYGLAVKSDVERVRTAMTKLAPCRDDLQAFIAERQLMMKKLSDHEFHWMIWKGERESRKSQEREDMRERRKSAIFAKLDKLGWGREIQLLNASEPFALSKHRRVSQYRDLTDRIWNNIAGELVEFMKVKRDERLKREKEKRQRLVQQRMEIVQKIVREYVSTQPAQGDLSNLVPAPADFCCMEPFLAIIMNSPDESAITKESFSHLLPQIPPLITEWLDAKTAELVQRVTGRPAVPMDDTWKQNLLENRQRLLTLASTFFTSNCSCKEPLSFPRVLVHECQYSPREFDMSFVFRSMGYPWMYRDIEFSNRASQIAQRIITSCRLDPRFTTTWEMDALDPWLECQRCVGDGNAALTMHWRSAILHDFNVCHHNASVVGQWRLLGLEEAEHARQLAVSTQNCFAGSDYSCLRCWARVDKFSLVTHLSSRHSMHRSIQQGDFLFRCHDHSMESYIIR